MGADGERVQLPSPLRRRHSRFGGLLQRSDHAPPQPADPGRVCARQLDGGAGHREPRPPLHPRGGVGPGGLPRGGVGTLERPLPRPLLRRGESPHLEQSGAPPIGRLRSLG